MIAKFLTTLFLSYFAYAQAVNANDDLQLEAQLDVLSNNCYQQWLVLDWKIGPQQTLAKNNTAFNDGIKRVCRARAELFLEGYQLSPLIEADSQEQVFPLVLRSSVAEIKEFLKQALPALKLI